MKMLYCSNCGKANQNSARFCKECGLPIVYSGPLTGVLAARAQLAGRYVVERKLGQGGMGAVYLVGDQRLGGKRMALKEMSDQGIVDLAERRAALAAFRQEAQMLAGLEHANLPKVTDYFEEGGNQYLVMEYVRGETLEKRLERAGRPLPEPVVRKVAEQLCDVLEYLHGQQPPIIFRDLKPGNIMLQAEERVKLIDFGIARHFKPGKNKDTQAMGTPGYAAPEQYGKGQSDARTDIYALGAVMHHMLTGIDPAHEPFRFAPVQSLQSKVTTELSQAVQKAVALDQAQRWQSVSELRKAMAIRPKGAGSQRMPAGVAATYATTAPPIATSASATTVTSTAAKAFSKGTAQGPAIPPPAVPNASPGQSTLIGIPQSQRQAQSALRPAMRRAHWLWFFLVVCTIGYLLPMPYIYQVVPFPFYQYGQVLVCGLLLAYLLTHRPLAMLLAVSVTLVIIAARYSDLAMVPWSLLLMAGSMEVLASLSLWRARNLLFLFLITAVGMVVNSSVAVTGITNSTVGIHVTVVDGVSPMLAYFQMLVMSVLAGVVIVWIASGVVNFFTGVGKH